MKAIYPITASGLAVILALLAWLPATTATAQPAEGQLTFLCYNRITGVARYSESLDDCSRYEHAVNLAQDGPVHVCAERSSGLIRVRDECNRAEVALELGGQSSVNLCASMFSAVLRLSPSGTCARGEFAVTAGTSVPIQFTIQAEDYNEGGQNVGYFDTTADNSGGEYRADDVDIQTCTDPATPAGENCYNVGWIRVGEWLAFDVSVATAGDYEVTFRTATPNSGGSLRLEIVDGQNVQDISGSVPLPNTGDWQNWTDVTTTVTLPAGDITLRVFAESDGFNLNYISFVEAAAH